MRPIRPVPREEVIAKYQQALQQSADAKRGEAVLKRACLNCHRLGDEGGEVGPNLATVQHRSPKELLVSVLDPNREVSPNYMQYLLLTRDGRSLTGIIADETSTSITLRPAEGTTQILLRNEIDEIRNSGIFHHAGRTRKRYFAAADGRSDRILVEQEEVERGI